MISGTLVLIGRSGKHPTSPFHAPRIPALVAPSHAIDGGVFGGGGGGGGGSGDELDGDGVGVVDGDGDELDGAGDREDRDGDGDEDDGAGDELGGDELDD